MAGEQAERSSNENESETIVESSEKDKERHEMYLEEADQEALSSMFGFYLVLGILVALMVVAILWIISSQGSEKVTDVKPGLLMLMCMPIKRKEVLNSTFRKILTNKRG